jgi:choice-of-anchor C domain-containing protein
LTAALVGMGVLAAMPAGAAAGLQNGSFETPVVAPGAWQVYSAGQSIGPWEVTGGSVDLFGAGTVQAADGHQAVDLSGNSAGAISQTFSTLPGEWYELVFALAGNTRPVPVVKTGQIFIDGDFRDDFSFDVTGKTNSNMGWVTESVRFRATGVSTTVEFVSTTARAWGPVIDAVSVDRCACRG